jgi:predicted nucleotidyltransferase component of viral defense system
MIPLAEIQHVAGSLGVAPTVVDHDYVLGWFLHFLGRQREAIESWTFKGGTSLQKCHFGDYRFSEDLDFTMTTSLTSEGLLAIVDRAKKAMQEVIGITTDAVPTRVESIEDDYGKESI